MKTDTKQTLDMVRPIPTSSNDLLQAACRLHAYILKEHWDGRALSGPDPGIRISARIGRFVKSYLNFLPWSDRLIYMQANGYWILNNWLPEVDS